MSGQGCRHRTARIRQLGQARKERTTRKGRPEHRTAISEQQAQGSQNETSRAGQPEQDSQNRASRTGQTEKDCQHGGDRQDRTARKGIRAGQLGQDSRDRIAGKNSQNRTARKEQPENDNQDCQDMTAGFGLWNRASSVMWRGRKSAKPPAPKNQTKV